MITTVSQRSSAAISAVLATAALVASITVAPSARAETGNVRATVESQLGKTMRMPAHVEGRKGTATVAVVVDGQGDIRSADLVRSSGFRSFDREALRTARAIDYPATARNRTFAVVLGFNQPVADHAKVESQRLVENYRSDSRVLFAGDTTAQPDS